mmetsp:Transcript_44485/g.100214  ORF Transcript_44485/g.100214 Transcript_44485/m.100214 type:complete len:765 (-) Transcript_44485:45-2339(-)
MVKKQNTPKTSKKVVASSGRGKDAQREESAGSVEPKRAHPTHHAVPIKQELLSRFTASNVAAFLLVLLSSATAAFSQSSTSTVALLCCVTVFTVGVMAVRSVQWLDVVEGVFKWSSLPSLLKGLQEQAEHSQPPSKADIEVEANGAEQAAPVPVPAMKLARAWLASARARGRGGDSQADARECSPQAKMEPLEEKLLIAGRPFSLEQTTTSTGLARHEFAVRRTFITLLDEHQASGVEDACSDPTTGGGGLVMGPRRWPKKKQQLLQKWPNADGGTSAEDSSASDWPCTGRPSSPHLSNVLETEDELELPLRNGQGSKSHGASISVPAGCCVQTPEGASLQQLFMRPAEQGAGAIPILDQGTAAAPDRSSSEPFAVDCVDEGEAAEPPPWVGAVVGQSALISGLTNAPQFNGQTCEISGYDTTMDRFLVQVLQPEGHVQAKLRLQNLTLGMQEGIGKLPGMPADGKREPAATQRNGQDATRSELTYNALATVPSKEILSATKCLPTVSSQMEGLPLAVPFLPEPWPEPWCSVDGPAQPTLGTVPVSPEAWASYPLPSYQAYPAYPAVCCQPEAAAAYMAQYHQGYFTEQRQQSFCASQTAQVQDRPAPTLTSVEAEMPPTQAGPSTGDLTVSSLVEANPSREPEPVAEPAQRSSKVESVDPWRPTLRTHASVDVPDVHSCEFPVALADEDSIQLGEPPIEDATSQQKASRTVRLGKLRQGKNGARRSAQSTESRQDPPISVTTSQTRVEATSSGAWKPSLYSKR